MIDILTTGGTIEGLNYEDIDEESKNPPIQINKFFENLDLTFQFSIKKVFSKDSRLITNGDRKILKKSIELSLTKNILITHGTITMIKTAKYLGNLGLDKTIVLVGAFIPGHEPNTDAHFNLGYAFNAAQRLNNGVYIAMHGNTFSWNNVVKNKLTNRFEKER
ncbi:asparaginase domain-containing protein [uncultured Croceitalea sp.]|uniref:asparaginase domain-containing protein n=1 Tax=uncultured Croceitalea sp. TaxID=1798908 RepID=UPI00374F7F74